MDGQRSGMREVLLVWAIYAIDAIAIFVTYLHVSHTDLYHVSHDGLAGAASRVFVFSNFSTSLVAVALLGFSVARLLALPVVAGHSRWLVTMVAIVGVLLCFVTALPGVVDQSDLDAKSVNALPALGVLIAIGLTVAAVRLGGVGPATPGQRRDSIGLALIGVVVILGLPWILADLGIFAGDIPGLGSIVMSKELPASGESLRAVHLGHHHGMDGVLFAVSALILARGFREVHPGRLKTVLGWYLALMLPYGLANALNDGWYEQLVKRGSTDWRIPEMLRPDLTVAWGILLLGMIAAWFIFFRQGTEPSPSNTTTEVTGLGPQRGIA